ncbi:MAG: GEVED domain-containing protein [Limnohabitans sp.]|nr:GEVED domain-containing protein [Limnohabitans sp.]
MIKRNMLKIIGIMVLSTIKLSAQFNSDAPWMSDMSLSSKKGEVSIDEMTNAFNQYWLTHDKNKKGSGYKPYMRWEYYWRNNVHPDGTLITPSEIWTAWQNKNRSKNNRRSVLATSNWQPVGPFSHSVTGSWSAGQGRVNVVYVDPNNASVIYVGTPAGGIWKSTDAGVNWTPLSDELPQIGVSGIVTDPTNSKIIYIATGDKDAGDTYSIGVMKSTDGGVTWNTTGLSFTNTSTRAADIFIHPSNPSILWVATSAGLYKTSNGGTNWTNVLNGNIKDIKVKPGDPNTVYAVTTNTFYKSTDAGSTFATITSGLPTSSGRLAIDVTPANSAYVYVLSATTGNGFQGLYKSTNSGASFTKSSSTTDIFESTQAWYDMALAVSSTNAEVVFTGCLNVWKTTNGGTTFTKVNNWNAPSAAAYTHADIHFLRYYGNKLFCGSDGGIYVSSNDGSSFTSLTKGLQIGQFYKIAVSKQSSGNMVGGLQDNGGYGYSNNQWKNYYGADGMDTGVDPNNQNKYYGFIQSGGGLYISNDGGNSLSSSVNGPASGNWVTPLAVNSAGEVFGGYNKVYRLNGTSWVGSTTTFPGNLENLIVDPSNNNIMYATDGKNLYRSSDKGVNFSLIYTFPLNVKDIKVHSTNGTIIYAITEGTSGLVYMSSNTGSTFTSINNGLPSIGKNVIVHQANNSSNPLYVGTSLGVYYKDDTMSSWTPFDSNLPNVSVTDLEINYTDNNITAATYGRGVWRTSLNSSSDTQAPSIPTNLTVSGTTSNSTNLAWTASTDNVGVTGYDVYRGTTLLGTVTGVSYTATGLTPSTTYSFTVRAKDAAGNVSASSNAVSVTTLASPSDTVAPTAPTLSASGTTSTSTNLSWSGATDNIGVTGYDVYRGTTFLASVTGTTYTATGLTPSTTYSFTVRAKDGAGNVSAASNAVSVTTTGTSLMYCASNGNNSSYEWIDYVALNGMINTTGSNGGYGNFTSKVAPLPYGSNTIYFSAGFSSSAYTEYWSIWIDYNKNGTFESTEKVVAGSSASSGTLSATFTVPTTALAGQTRMRVQMKYSATSTACETFTYGEVEDYTVNIGSAAPSTNYSKEEVLANESNIYDFELYPNSVESSLNINMFDSRKVSYKVYNLTGQAILGGELINPEINVSKLPSGMYIIDVNDGQKSISKKFLKK